jgi:hypothetical protein
MAGFAGGDSGADAARTRIQRERRLEASNDAEIRRQLDIIAGSDAPIGGAPRADVDAAPEGVPLQTAPTLPQADVESIDEDVPLDDRRRRMAMTAEREAIAIAMLAEGKSQADVARAIDVSRATLSRWAAARKAEERPVEAVDTLTGEIGVVSPDLGVVKASPFD